MSLSGGQKQRIAIARALLPQPRLLVFDEATSALDALSAASIRATIIGLARGAQGRQRTIVLVAHHAAELSVADRIAVLDCGRLAQWGSYEELVRTPGLLRTLVLTSGGLQP